jgi:hypothetical protein
MPAAPLPLHAVSRLPAPGDNVAIAIRRLEADEVLAFPDGPRALAHTVLEGHRFAVSPIAPGAFLLSWGLPFARALRPIAPGDYVSNASMLEALAVRQVPGIRLPATANFEDYLEHFLLDEATFRPAPPVPRVAAPRTFAGYRRPGRRGVGTRNTIVILGTTSHTASFARQLTARLQPLARIHPELDGIVAIAHTEGGGPANPTTRRRSCARSAGSWCTRTSAPSSPSTTAPSRSRTSACRSSCAPTATRSTTCRISFSPSIADSPPGSPRASASCAAGCPRCRRNVAPTNRCANCGSPCSAGAPTRFRAYPEIHSPARSCTRSSVTAAPAS